MKAFVRKCTFLVKSVERGRRFFLDRGREKIRKDRRDSSVSDEEGWLRNTHKIERTDQSVAKTRA